MKYKYTNHWTCNNIIIIKPTFNDELKNIIYEDNFVHIVFTDYSNLNIGINYYMKKNSDSKITSCLSKFDKSIDNLFNYNKLKYLTFGYSFNQLVDNLPLNLSHLTFGNLFNQLVDNLPHKIKNITFGLYFNQSVNNLPSSLINIKFGHITPIDTILTTLISRSGDITSKMYTIINLPYEYTHQLDDLPSNVKIHFSKLFIYKDLENSASQIYIE
jgi:hypothetical protein